MSRHLSSEGISQWVAGERSPEAEQHVRECPECTAEVARFEGALALFRESARQWSERQPGSHAGLTFEVAPERNRFARHPEAWAAVVTAALMLAAAVPIYRSSRHHSTAAETMAEADVRLLEQVDAGVSRAVPRPMEPLLKLVSADSVSSDAAGKDTNDETTQHK